MVQGLCFAAVSPPSRRKQVPGLWKINEADRAWSVAGTPAHPTTVKKDGAAFSSVGVCRGGPPLNNKARLNASELLSLPKQRRDPLPTLLCTFSVRFLMPLLWQNRSSLISSSFLPAVARSGEHGSAPRKSKGHNGDSRLELSHRIWPCSDNFSLAFDCLCADWTRILLSELFNQGV